MNQILFPMCFRNNIAVLILLSCSPLFVSCEEEPEPLTTNSVITGSAYLDDLDYDQPADILVIASGPYGKKSAVSDADGGYTIRGLGNGTYYLDLSREGYGTVRQYGIQLFGNDTVHAEGVDLYKMPPSGFKMPQFTYAAWVERSFLISTNYTKQYVFWETMLFFSTDNNVSASNFAVTYGTNCNWNNEIRVPDYVLPFPRGTKVYVIGYSCNQRDNGYLDTYRNERIFSTLNGNNYSNIISFTIP